MSKKLRIAQIAPLRFPIPPRKYGGIERIVSFLTEELFKRGYQVTLFASGNSKTRAKLVSVIKKDLDEKKIPWADWYWNIFNHSSAFQMEKKFDIFHSHCGFMGIFFEKFIKIPVLHTLHNIPNSSDHRWGIFKHFKDYLNVVFISKSEQKNSPLRFKKEWVVYNGINVSQFKFNLKPKNHFIWVGRIDPRKGPQNAIQIAKRLGLKLLLVGQIQSIYKDYFQREIKPHLTSKIRFIGEVPQKELPNFYTKAKALLYPIEWEEPFGLVMAESMACGTPVVAFKRGSVPEVIKDGKTGFIVEPFDKQGKPNLKGFIEAIKKIDQIDRRECRKWVEENFTIEKMVDGYERVYKEILKREN